jgi:L-ascorbate metabolism protein UlaG (beta-lactamase superfamily)
VEISYFGANCIRLTSKKASIVVDDELQNIGLKSITKSTDIGLRTNQRIPKHNTAFEADMPGEYEISGAIIRGIAARSHMDEEGKSSAVIYTVNLDGVKVAVLGHIYPELSESQLEQIGMVDILIAPVGNSGYTMDGLGALKVIKQIEPKVVIPTHFSDKSISYEVPQVDLDEALKGLGMEISETLDKLKYKNSEMTDSTRLIVLNRQ